MSKAEAAIEERHSFLLFEPSYEAEVLLLFGLLLPYLDGQWIVEEYDDNFPDCTLLINGIRLEAEFETYTSHFYDQGHDPTKADLIIVWKNNRQGKDHVVVRGTNEILELVEARRLKKVQANLIPVFDLSELVKSKNLHLISENHPKYLDNNIPRTREEFLSQLKQNRPDDYAKYGRLIDAIESTDGIQYELGTGKRFATFKVYFEGLGSSPFVLESSGKVWVNHLNVNDKTKPILIQDKKWEQIKSVIGSKSDQYQYIASNDTDELINKSLKVLEILKS